MKKWQYNQDFNKAIHLPIIQQNIDKVITNSKNVESDESIEIQCSDVTNIVIKAPEISLKRKHKLKPNSKKVGKMCPSLHYGNLT